MSRQYWQAPLPPLGIADGAALASSTTLTDISPTPSIVIPANQLELGSELYIEAMGEFSDTATPTLLLGLYFGGVAGVALAASAAITAASGVTGVPWILKYRGVVRAVGSSGSINGQGVLILGTSLTAVALSPIPITKALRTVTIDTTTAKAITVGAQWGASSPSNTVTCNDLSVSLVT